MYRVFRKTPRTTGVGVHLREVGTEIRQCLIDHGADRTKRVIFGDEISGEEKTNTLAIFPSGPRITFSLVFRKLCVESYQINGS
jgi:hypothetical protein